MFLNPYCAVLPVLENNINVNIILMTALIIFFLFTFCSSSFAQWVNNPSENTKLADGLSQPVNISSVTDNKGGMFLFWQDQINSFQNDIYYLHINSSGKPDLITKGKSISALTGEKQSPVSVPGISNTAVVVWRDFTGSTSGNLYAQKISLKGELLWGEYGIEVTKPEEKVLDFSAASDDSGNIFVAYFVQDIELNEYKVLVQKISPGGTLYYQPEKTVIFKSGNRKLMPYIVTNNNSAVIFWIESENGKSVLFTQKINSSGNLIFGRKPLPVSDKSRSVVTFSVGSSGLYIYTAWQTLKEKEIYHQLIGPEGKMIWGRGGKIASYQDGFESNPQVTASSLQYYLSWVNEIGNDKNIFVQKFNNNGKSLWNNEATPVINISGSQFGQKIVNDGEGGVTLAWIDRRVETLRGNIFAQRINSKGEKLWDSSAFAVGIYYNSEKSYLSVLPGEQKSTIVIFRDRRNDEYGIYGQKIFNTGTYISQLIGYNTELVGDSVKISWYCANEFQETIFDIERMVESDTSDFDWSVVASFTSKEKSSASYYEYLDQPDVSGTIYYRLIQKNANNNIYQSEISKINYLKNAEDVIITQNIPNPFSDFTDINFYLPDPSRVKIEFYNSRIEKISEISEKEYSAGQNKITFYSQDLQPGIYFYRITVKDFVEVKKMVLIR